MAESDKDKDTSEARLYNLRKLDQAFKEVKAAFARWKTSGKRVKEEFKITSDKTAVKEEDTEEPRDRAIRRTKDTDKVSTNDAKPLKPETLETSLPPLQIKNWYRTWDNYMIASGWGHGENYHT